MNSYLILILSLSCLCSCSYPKSGSSSTTEEEFKKEWNKLKQQEQENEVSKERVKKSTEKAETVVWLGEVIGSWQAKNKFGSGMLSHTKTIYKEGDKIMLRYYDFGDGSGKLNKDGTGGVSYELKKTEKGRYKILGREEFGEYLIIDDNGNLRMFDKEGDVSPFGWSFHKKN